MAQSPRDVDSRLNRLENEIDTLNRAVYRGDVPPSAPAFAGGGQTGANIEVRLQQLEGELRDLRGMLEEQSYAVRQVQERLERGLSDIELRLGALDGGAGAAGVSASASRGAAGFSPVTGYSPSVAASATPPAMQQSFSPPPPAAKEKQAQQGEPSRPEQTQPAAGDALGTLSDGGDQAASLYENAFALLKNSQYDRAEKEFQNFINQYPGHALTGNAQYWMGETFYVRGQYERAARAFAEGYKGYPDGPKAADNLLKLGMSLDGLGNTQDACVAFAQLEKEFAGKAQPALRRAQQEMTRLGCI